jgi:transaldolase
VSNIELYLDSGNLDEIKEIASFEILNGVTTNPSLVLKGGMDFKTLIRSVITVLNDAKIKNYTVSAEVTADTADEMIKQGVVLAKIAPHVLIKVPITIEGIKAIKFLSQKKIRTNATLCFSVNQALLAAKAGAYVVSPFVGRLDDAGQSGIELIKEIRKVYDNYQLNTKIIAASIRSTKDVKEAALAGAEIATIPYKIFKQIYEHPLTNLGLKKFNEDWGKYNEIRR